MFLNIVKRYSLVFRDSLPDENPIKAKQNRNTYDTRDRGMLEIEAVRREMYGKDQFVSHIFLAPQKDRGQGPLINFSRGYIC